MDPYITGAGIKALREKRCLTQAALAEKLNVSDKAVSKWETGKGYPDISLLEPLAAALGVSLTELLARSAVENANVSANMLRSHFYVCPVCGNVLHSMGAAAVSCPHEFHTPSRRGAASRRVGGALTLSNRLRTSEGRLLLEEKLSALEG